MKNEVKFIVDLPEEVLQKIEQTIVETLDRVLSQRVESILVKPKNLTRSEAAKKLRVSLPTLSAYERQGLIKAQRIGRRVTFREADIDAYLQGSIRHKTY